jgi:hypothetical protein
VTTAFALLGILILAAPIPAAFIGHRLAWRRQRAADDIERIETGLVVVASPLIRPAWPQPQSPRQLEAAYDDTPTVVSYPLYRLDLEPELRYLAERGAGCLVHRAVAATPDYVPRHAALPEHDTVAVPAWSDWSATTEMARIRVEMFAA